MLTTEEKELLLKLRFIDKLSYVKIAEEVHIARKYVSYACTECEKYEDEYFLAYQNGTVQDFIIIRDIFRDVPDKNNHLSECEMNIIRQAISETITTAQKTGEYKSLTDIYKGLCDCINVSFSTFYRYVVKNTDYNTLKK